MQDLKTNLNSLNYHTFAFNVTEELHFQDLLYQKRQLEKETSINAKSLAEDYKKEYQDYITETKEAQQEIQKLRDDAAQQKITQTFSLKYREKDLNAGYLSEYRNRQEAEAELLDQIKELNKNIATEKEVHARIEKFMTEAKDKILKDNDEWRSKKDQDLRNLNIMINAMSEKKDKAKQKMEAFYLEIDQEKRRLMEREKDEKEREERLKQEREDNERKTGACEVVKTKAKKGGKKKK